MYPEDGLSERIDRSEPVFRGDLLKVDRVYVTLPNGKNALRECVRHVGAVAILPVDSDGTVYLEKQFRTALNDLLIEIPAGKLNAKDEDRLLAAKRELREETGLTADSWLELAQVCTAPGFCDEKITIFLARGLTKGETEPDEDEFIRIIPVPYDELYRMTLRGELHDAKTVSAILLAREHLEGKE